jgi:FMN phosphatase YigB (HAD superfamily)
LTAVVSSRDLGTAMPDPANYRAAAAALGLAPHEAAFVGHDARELSGARSVGMPTMAVNHDFDAPADVYLDRIEALPACLDTAARSSNAAGQTAAG